MKKYGMYSGIILVLTIFASTPVQGGTLLWQQGKSRLMVGDPIMVPQKNLEEFLWQAQEKGALITDQGDSTGVLIRKMYRDYIHNAANSAPVTWICLGLQLDKYDELTIGSPPALRVVVEGDTIPDSGILVPWDREQTGMFDTMKSSVTIGEYAYHTRSKSMNATVIPVFVRLRTATVPSIKAVIPTKSWRLDHK